MMGLIAFGDRALLAIERLFLLLANACLALMLVANAVNIFWRGVFDVAITLVWPWTLLLFVWMSFLGFYVIYRRAKDITVDYFVDLIGPAARHATRLLSSAITVGLMALLLWQAPVTLESQVGDMELIALERYWMSVPLFASATLIALHFLLDIVKALAGLPEHRPDHLHAES